MPNRPNILFLLPDQHRPDWLGCNESLPLRTPNLDGLAAGGMRFTNAYCTSPLCAPSRASLASGRHYHHCGVRNNMENYPLRQPTYYQSLRDAGYRVAGVGKFDLHKDISQRATLGWNLDGSRLITEWGFTEGIDNEGKFDGSGSYRDAGKPMGPYLSFLHDRGLAEVYLREHEEAKKYLDAYTTVLPDEAYCDNWLSENGITLLRGFPAGEPWHLVVNFTGPHNPMDVTASMRERWEHVEFPLPHMPGDADPADLLRNHQNYAAMIENIDRLVGLFIDAVRDRGELDNTLVVFSSDHGEMLGDHARWGKSIWYEPSIGVPLIISGPGVKKGIVSDALVSLHDLAATFVDYAGSRQMPGMDASSLRPVLEGDLEGHRDFVVTGLEQWCTVFDGRHKLVLGDRIGGHGAGPQLFDLEVDPREDSDIAAGRPDLVDSLRRHLN